MKEISILFIRHERRTESQTIGFCDLKFFHIATDFSFMSRDIQWIHKGSSCLDHQCQKFHLLKYIMIERKFQALSGQCKKSFLTDDRKKNPIRPIRLNDRLNNNADMQINTPDLIYLIMKDLRSCSISDSSIKCVPCLYELLYNYLWPRLLHPNSADNSGAQRDRGLGPQISLPT